ncbi:MAG: hypothetical protein H0V78_00945 [Burkholderiales bacterium]|nr:hypothetical protein [Burkholderiales bacterium]
MNVRFVKRKKLATIIALLSCAGIITIAVAFSTLFHEPDNFHEVILLLLLGLAPCTLGLMFASIINGADEG